MVSVEADPMRKAKHTPIGLITYLLYGKKYNANLNDQELAQLHSSRCKFEGYINLNSTDLPELTALEMRDCSKWNTSSSDHYLHLVISLAPDEHLDEEQWKDSVNSYLKALSLEEHQCMFTVHQDNDAEHCHILVNKVHPKTHKINNLSYSRRKEQKVDLKLEEKYGFRILNHPRTKEEEQKIKPNTKANDFESQTAQESLYSYVTRIMENSPTINSWENLHIYLAKNGIEIQKYGRGIILKSSDPNDPKKDIAVKGSSIKYNGSTLSLYNLEKRFGKYEPFNKQKKEEVKIENSYKAESKTASNVKDNDAIKSLYEEFQTNKKAYLELSEKVKFRKSQIYLQRRTADQKLKKKHKKLVKAINELYKNDPKKRKLRLDAVNNELKKALKKNKQLQLKAIKALDSKLEPFNYERDFLKFLRKVSRDSELARKILLERKKKLQQLEQNFSEPSEQLAIFVINGKIELTYCYFDKTTNNGTDIYRSQINNDWIKDRGDQLYINDKPTMQTVKDFLLLANQKFGQNGKIVKIHGNKEFQMMCAIQAAYMGINIKCDLDLAQNLYIRKKVKFEQNRGIKDEFYWRSRKHYNGRSRSGLGGRIGRSFGRGSIFARAAATIFSGINFGQSKQDQSSISGSQFSSIAKDATAGTQKDSAKERSMHNVPKSDLDSTQKESAVLLHADERLHMEQPGNGNNDRLRWSVRSDRGIKTLDQYIDERNAKHDLGFDDVLLHKKWQGEKLKAKFQGIRKLADSEYALFEADQIMYMKPVSEKIVSMLKRKKRGTLLDISANGFIKIHVAEQEQSHSYKL